MAERSGPTPSLVGPSASSPANTVIASAHGAWSTSTVKSNCRAPADSSVHTKASSNRRLPGGSRSGGTISSRTSRYRPHLTTTGAGGGSALPPAATTTRTAKTSSCRRTSTFACTSARVDSAVHHGARRTQQALFPAQLRYQWFREGGGGHPATPARGGAAHPVASGQSVLVAAKRE